MTLNPAIVRQQFPSLDRRDVFFDNPGGTQIAKQSLDRINRYLLECNANHEGAFPTDELLLRLSQRWLSYCTFQAKGKFPGPIIAPNRPLVA